MLATQFDPLVDRTSGDFGPKDRDDASTPYRDSQARESLGFVYYGVIFVFISALFVIGFAATYTTSEQYVYFWDYALYWGHFGNLGTLLCSDLGRGLSLVFRSITESDYNFLAVLPIAPVACIFGGSRVAYIVSIATFFVLPTAFLAARFMVSSLRSASPSIQVIVFSFATMTLLLLHPIWIPVLEGRPDVFGLAIIFGILAIVVRQPLAGRSLLVLAAVGLLLAILFFIRRWYAYWVVAFFPAALVADTFRVSGGGLLKRILPVARSLTVVGVVFSATVWSIATPLMIRIFSTDYSVAYSAYKTSTAPLKPFLKAVDYFGLPLLIIAAAGLVLSFARSSSRYFAIFIFVQTIIISVLFFRVQDFGPQHYLLLVPLVYYGVATVIVYPFLSSTLRRAGFAGSVIAVGLIFLSSVVVFSESARAKIPGEIKVLIPQVTRFPKIRNDLDRLGTLISELEKQYQKDPGKIYTIASSVTINDSILRTFCRESEPKSLDCGAILGTGHVDKRDGFPTGFLNCKYAVLATPAQYHLRAEEQRIVGILAREFQTNSGVARSFTRVGNSVVLDRDVEVSIFKKVEPIPDDKVGALSEEFVRIYPEQKGLFSLSR